MKATLTFVLFVSLAAAGMAQDRLSEMLRKGIVEEETNRNLAAAAQTYQSVLAQFDEERKVAATALFRLAECYRKLAKKDQAIAAYSRVVREFADQTKLAEQSRSVLSATYRQAPASPATDRADARLRYRAHLEEEIKIVEGQLAETEKKIELGAFVSTEIATVKMQMLELKKELAAFDAGMVDTPARRR